MKFLMNKIASWHEFTFDSTEEAQWLKLKEEELEAQACERPEDWYKELADVFFVYAALVYRYKSEQAKTLFEAVWNTLAIYQRDRVYDELKAKFEINKNRTWEKQPDGTYHHV